MAEVLPYLIGSLVTCALFLAAWLFKKTPTDVPADLKKIDVEKKTAALEKVLEAQALENKKTLEDRHSGEVIKTVEDLKKAAPEYVESPDRLNEFLLQVGKDVRGRPE